MKNLIYLAVLIPFLSGCQVVDHWMARKDFKEICQVAKGFKAGSDEDPVMQAVRFANEFSAVTDSDSVKQAFKALAMADPGQKYSMLLMTAKEVGLESYSCPEMEELLSPSQ